MNQRANETALLHIENLSLLIQNPKKQLSTLIDNINFKIFPAETFVLVGESGSGKTITALSILRLLPDSIFPSQDAKLYFLEQNLLDLSESNMRTYRGNSISMIFQEPMTSFNPILTIGEQIEEGLKVHKLAAKSSSKPNLKALCYELLGKVQISDPERVYYAYPHQLSGGMKQRAMIAMALVGKPKLLIADEPTTALDVTTQAEILKLLKHLQKTENMAILFITHDIAVAKIMGDRIGVMHYGKMIEQGITTEIIASPKTAYTRQHLNAKPVLKIEALEPDSERILQVEKVSVYFPVQKGLFKKVVKEIKAVEDVSFNIQSGETLALIGESGCGKSTLAKAIMSLLNIHTGKILIENENIHTLNKNALRSKRSNFQMIFQDPFSSLNPRMMIGNILKEGMLAQRIGNDDEEREERVDELLRQVGLVKEFKNRYPHAFSGGQRQRICIARALAVGPRLLICDEPTSSLDVSVEAKILDLFISLQNDLDLSYLFITHNFKVVRLLAHNVAVMRDGKIIEYGPTEAILNDPKNDFTKKLLMAEPKI